MDIFKLETSAGADVYYEQGFRIVIEDHLQFLKTHPETIPLEVESVYAYKYSGDLSGLLSFYGRPVYMHWIIMRLNGYNDFTEVGESALTLLIPSENVIERIRAIYKTKNRSII